MDMPDSLGRYRLERELGHGTMGVVYEGWDDDLNRRVAIKIIRTSELLDPELASEYSRRFIQEAKNAGQLMHPNIVTVFDFGNEAGMNFLVMELIRGKELKTYLDAGHVFSIPEAVAIACQLLEALDYVHSKHIFHRDIKPANVMLEAATQRVRLTDFGVARFSAGDGQDGTGAGTVVGTPGYMSPEQINGMSAGAGVDLFAAGVLLYQCLTLHRPFAGKNAMEIWQKTVHEEPAPMFSYRDGIPPALERAVRHALAKNTLERPASARALIDELQDAIAGANFDDEGTRMLDVGRQDVPRHGSSVRPQARASAVDLTPDGDRPDPARHPAPGGPKRAILARAFPTVGGAGLVLLVALTVGHLFVTPARVRPAPTTAAPSDSTTVPPASPITLPAPVNHEVSVDRIPAEGQVTQAQGDRPDNARRLTKGRDSRAVHKRGTPGELGVSHPERAVETTTRADAGLASPPATEMAKGPGSEAPAPAPEADWPDMNEDAAPRDGDEHIASMLTRQARYLKAAEVAESKGDRHSALVLYKHAYDAGSGSDRTRSMRDISGRAARAMSEIFGREGAHVEQFTWHLNAKTMEAGVTTTENR